MPRRGAPGDLRDAFLGAVDACEAWEAGGEPEPLVELRDHRGAASFWVERRFVTEVLRRDPARTQANVLHDDSWQAQLRREWDRQEREKQAQPRDLPLRAGEE